MMRTQRLDPAATPEYRAVMGATVVLSGLTVLGSVIPAVDHLISLGMLGLVALTVLLVAVRLLVRFVRERIEDAADGRTAAAWRATHRTAHHHVTSGLTPMGVA